MGICRGYTTENTHTCCMGGPWKKRWKYQRCITGKNQRLSSTAKRWKYPRLYFQLQTFAGISNAAYRKKTRDFPALLSAENTRDHISSVLVELKIPSLRFSFFSIYIYLPLHYICMYVIIYMYVYIDMCIYICIYSNTYSMFI